MSHRLQDLHATGAPPLDVARWPAAHAETLTAWTEMVGPIGDPLPARWDVLSRKEFPTHSRLHIGYQTADGDRVPALVLVPRRPGPWPGVLALHPTSEDGKRDVATPEGRDNRRYGLELVERGYLVMAPDTITAGERVADDQKPFHTAGFVAEYPELSPVGKMIADHRQAVSVLAAIEGVDADRIGAIGHSLGGYNSWFLAGLDPRVKAVVSSCGFATFAGDSERHRWGNRDWFSHLPRLSPLIDRGEVPFEFHEILALMAPRPLFTYLAMGDEYFPHWQQGALALDRVHDLYTALGMPEAMVTWIGHGGHDFPPPVREAAYRFLDTWLRPSVTG